MSKIGEYIHYHASRYDKYGIGRDKDGASPINLAKHHAQLNSYIKNNINKKSSFSEKDKQDLAQGIMAFMKPTPETNEELIAAHSLLSEKMENKLVDKLEKAILQTSTMSLDLSKTQLSGGIGQAKKYSKGFSSYMYYNSTLNKIDSLLQNFAKELKQHRKYSAVQKLKNDFLNLEQDVITKINYKTGGKSEIKIVKSSKSQSLEDIYERLNKYIQTFAAIPDVANIEGASFENAVALALNCAANQTKEKMNKVLESVVVGDKNQAKIQRYDTNRFASNLINQHLGDDTFLNITSNLKNKVDVIIEWKGQNKGISAKNYNFTDDFKTMVSVVGGSSLMYMIQDLDTDFINHFLNAIASHRNKQEIQNNKEIRETMKQFLFYKGLTGDTYGRSKSDIPELMIVNNKNTGQVQVLDLKDLYNKINNNIGMLSVKIGGVNIMTARIYNEYIITNEEDGPSWHLAKVRIANYLLNVHNAKVSASFNGGILTW